MTSQETKFHLWDYIDQFRGKVPPSQYLYEAITQGIDFTWKDLHPFLSRIRDSEPTLPNYVIEFICEYLFTEKPDNILDPWSRYGVIPIALAEKGIVQSAIGIDPNNENIRLSKYLGNNDKNQWIHANPLLTLQDKSDNYDAIVSSPPIGLTRTTRSYSTQSGDITIRDSETNVLVLDSCRKLSDLGEAIFVLPNNFPWSRPNSAHSFFSQFRLYVHTIIALPQNVLAPWTNIEVNLFFISRKNVDQVFVNYLDPDKNNDEIIENIRKHKNGVKPRDGFLINIGEFRSWQALVIGEEIELEAQRSATKIVRLGDINKSIRVGRPKEEDGGFEELPNSIYLPVIGNSPAITRLADLVIKSHNYAQIQLSEEMAFADYVAGYFNTPLGMKVRLRLSQGGIIPRIRPRELNSAHVILPDIETQTQIVNVHNKLQDLKLMLEDQEDKLWSQPNSLAEISSEIESFQVKEKESFQDWMNSLPFPLASILWRYLASDGTQDKVDHLLHFFEAFAQFLTTLLLSAYHLDKKCFTENKKSWIDSNGDLSNVFKRATFGNWVVIGERVAKSTRRMLSSRETRLDVFEYIRTDQVNFIEALTSKRVFGVLKSVNAYRNDWRGHGGIAGDVENQRRLTAIETELRELRETLRNCFVGFVLISPKTASQSKGIFYYKARSIMGANPLFRTIDIETTIVLEDGELYFQDLTQRNPIKLIPFFRMLPSPQDESNACYFYNRLESDGVRWVSYHFEQKPELNQVDDGLIDFFADLDRI